MTNRPRELALDLTALAQSDRPYNERIALCEKLGLVETAKHGEHDYVRVTDAGYDVLSALMRMLIDATVYQDKPLKLT